jgi:uncharacterized repeat protein (TIGR03899 family)
MDKEKAEVIVVENDLKTTTKVELTEQDLLHYETPENKISQQFFKLAKKLAVDGALLSENKQMPIEDRTSKRLRLSQLRKQQNIENIIQKTSLYCADFEIEHRLDFDWLARFISLSEDICNASMQDLWAKILAGELTEPGSFSFKSLKVFRDMSIHDAKLLAKACSLAIKDPNKNNIRLLTGTYQKPGLVNLFTKNRHRYCNLSRYGLNHNDLLTLSEGHLIYIQETESSLLHKGEILNFDYNGSPLKLSAKKNNVCLQFYKFTPIGVELAQLIGDNRNEDFSAHLQQCLSNYFIVNHQA